MGDAALSARAKSTVHRMKCELVFGVAADCSQPFEHPGADNMVRYLSAAYALDEIVRAGGGVSWMSARRSSGQASRLTHRLQVCFSARDQRTTTAQPSRALHAVRRCTEPTRTGHQKQKPRIRRLDHSLHPNLLLHCPYGKARHKLNPQSTESIPRSSSCNV